jgi:hypothetical protein
MFVSPLLSSFAQHFRNFVTESAKQTKALGFEELPPNRTAGELFTWHAPNKSHPIAIISRWDNNASRAYQDALLQAGYERVRILSNTTLAEQDFCILLRATRLVASAVSTFGVWAAILGNASQAHLYIHDNPGLRFATRGHESLWQTFGYNWTNPKLQERIQFEMY